MLRDGPRVELVPTEGIVEHARLRKDDGEQATLREAARRLSAVLQGVLADVRAGLTEIDVALGLEAGMRRIGFTRPAFDTIVASGPRLCLTPCAGGGGPSGAATSSCWTLAVSTADTAWI